MCVCSYLTVDTQIQFLLGSLCLLTVCYPVLITYNVQCTHLYILTTTSVTYSHGCVHRAYNLTYLYYIPTYVSVWYYAMHRAYNLTYLYYIPQYGTMQYCIHVYTRTNPVYIVHSISHTCTFMYTTTVCSIYSLLILHDETVFIWKQWQTV